MALYKVIDNYLHKQDADFIATSMMGQEFPWYYNDGHTEYPQLVHLFWIPSEGIERFGATSIQASYFDILTPLLRKLQPLAIIRIKANCNWRVDNAIARPFHVDFESIQCKTAIYYVNTNDGYTLLKDGTKINSVANRLLIMDSDVEHAAVPSTDTERRVLINLNYHPS